jgi:hypothetical protein
MDGGSAAIFNDRGESFAERNADPVAMIRDGVLVFRRSEVTKRV